MTFLKTKNFKASKLRKWRPKFVFLDGKKWKIWKTYETKPIPGTPTISYQSDYRCMHCHLCPEQKKYWHGLVHLQWIEFPALEFHLLKSELNYLSSLKSELNYLRSLKSELNILSSLKSEDNFESISEFIPSRAFL